MRSFASVLLLFAACLIVAAALAYPVWVVVCLIDLQPIHRVVHRIALLAAIIGLVWLVRRWRLFDWNSAGFDLPRRQFWIQLGLGVVAGGLVITPLLVTLQLLDVRHADPRVELTIGLVADAIAKGLASGLAVALLEEMFFRGYLFTAIARESGRVAAVVMSSLLYASLHFLDGRLPVAADQIDWSSGFAVLERMFMAYSDPLNIVDSFLSLFAVGILLALARMRTGAIALCTGLHAAWVCALYYCEVTTQFNPQSPLNWMVGSYDHVIGWATVGWMGVMALCYLVLTRSRNIGLPIAVR